ncbi:hypothetical protein [Burkholderia territorii]|uniref:hypothetical protein n=1 Tax=Burkholderia territorii TaxID=1503055 RepID=UPI001E3DC627|nr:hypothetical protein [Burkholderia territorii]
MRAARGLREWAIAQLLETMLELSEADRCKLSSTSPHAFRHTVGTTSIYVSPEEARMHREAAKYHARLARDT